MANRKIDVLTYVMCALVLGVFLTLVTVAVRHKMRLDSQAARIDALERQLSGEYEVETDGTRTEIRRVR